MLKRSLSGAVCSTTKATPASPRRSPTSVRRSEIDAGDRRAHHGVRHVLFRQRQRGLGRGPRRLRLLIGRLRAVVGGLRDRLVAEQALLALEVAMGVVLGGPGARQIRLGPLDLDPRVVGLQGQQRLATADPRAGVDIDRCHPAGLLGRDLGARRRDEFAGGLKGVEAGGRRLLGRRGGRVGSRRGPGHRGELRHVGRQCRRRLGGGCLRVRPGRLLFCLLIAGAGGGDHQGRGER